MKASTQLVLACIILLVIPGTLATLLNSEQDFQQEKSLSADSNGKKAYEKNGKSEIEDSKALVESSESYEARFLQKIKIKIKIKCRRNRWWCKIKIKIKTRREALAPNSLQAYPIPQFRLLSASNIGKLSTHVLFKEIDDYLKGLSF